MFGEDDDNGVQETEEGERRKIGEELGGEKLASADEDDGISSYYTCGERYTEILDGCASVPEVKPVFMYDRLTIKTAIATSPYDNSNASDVPSYPPITLMNKSERGEYRMICNIELMITRMAQ